MCVRVSGSRDVVARQQSLGDGCDARARELASDNERLSRDVDELRSQLSSADSKSDKSVLSYCVA